MKTIYKLLFPILVLLLLVGCTDDAKEFEWEWPDALELEKIPIAEKPKVLWIDAAANFKYLANDQEGIKKYLDLAKENGFTEVVVDVRPGCGDVLYKSDIVQEVKKLGDVERTATWDYLGVFIEEAHKRGLKITASAGAVMGGTIYDGGLLFRDADKKSWATMLYKQSGDIINIMDDASQDHKAFNIVNSEVQDYVISIMTEIVTKYPDLDGISYDYARFISIESDFSDLTKKLFEKYIGETLENFPKDIFTWGGDGNPSGGKYYKKWLEFRAKIIYDLFDRTRKTIKTINPNIQFGSYTGAWYSTYYDVAANWASQKYDPSKYYQWASPEYKNYGYAGLLDFYMTGAYGETLYGPTSEWTVEGGILTAQRVVMGDVRVIGGLYGLNFEGKPEDCEEAVYIALTVGDGLMFFDMIYLILYDQWGDVKKGIERALATDNK